MKNFLLFSLILLAGCAAPSNQEMARVDYGPAPLDHQSTIQGWMNRTLKDPYTAHVEFHEPGKFWYREGIARGGKLHYGWMVKADINSKNSFGGYTGSQLFGFFFERGTLTRVFNPEDWSYPFMQK
jgi:hypothetical protein